MFVERFDLLLYDLLKGLRRNGDGNVRLVDFHLLVDRSELEKLLCFIHRVVNIQRHAVAMRVVRLDSIPNALRLQISRVLFAHIAILNRFRKRSGDRKAAQLRKSGFLDDSEFVRMLHDGKPNRLPTKIKQYEFFGDVVIKEAVRKTKACGGFDQLDIDRKALRDDGKEGAKRVGDLRNHEEHDRDRFVETGFGLSLRVSVRFNTHFYGSQKIAVHIVQGKLQALVIHDNMPLLVIAFVRVYPQRFVCARYHLASCEGRVGCDQFFRYRLLQADREIPNHLFWRNQQSLNRLHTDRIAVLPLQ